MAGSLTYRRALRSGVRMVRVRLNSIVTDTENACHEWLATLQYTLKAIPRQRETALPLVADAPLSVQWS